MDKEKLLSTLGIVFGVMFLSLGVRENNIIVIMIGGFIIGVTVDFMFNQLRRQK